MLRASEEALLTILQVLLYDPLYAWTISPRKAYMLQQIRTAADTSTATAANDDLNVTAGDLFHEVEEEQTGECVRED